MSQTVSAPMKRTLVLTLVAGISILAATAHAADGRIDFTGSILGNTCTITVNGSVAPAAATINMAAARDSDLNAATKTAVPTPFDIVLTKCVTGGKASAYFEPTPANIDANGRIKNTGTAGNVALELYDRARSNAAISIVSLQTTTTRASITSGNATLQYGVRYYANAAATVGTVKGTVTYTVLYE